jgi:hypothetical protein
MGGDWGNTSSSLTTGAGFSWVEVLLTLLLKLRGKHSHQRSEQRSHLMPQILVLCPQRIELLSGSHK